MTHDTKRTDNSFHIIQFTRQFCLSFMSLGLALSRSGHSPTHTHMLSLSTSLYPSLSSIILSLMANLIAIESRDDGREAKREEEDIPIGNISRRG